MTVVGLLGSQGTVSVMHVPPMVVIDPLLMLAMIVWCFLLLCMFVCIL
jgi:hypothetical protein